MFAFVVFSLISSVVSQEIDWEERLWNNIFCVKWDVEPQISNSSNSKLVYN